MFVEWIYVMDEIYDSIDGGIYCEVKVLLKKVFSYKRV